MQNPGKRPRRNIKKLPEKIEQILADRDPENKRPVAYVPQDEGRFGRTNELQSCWAPKGIRPEVAQQIIREYLNVYAAVRPALAKMTALILPWVNTEMMNIFLEEVSRDFSDFFVIMQVDQAGWHNSKNLIIPENILLHAQPARSPELNPVEHLWDELREKASPNMAFKSLKEVEQALCSEIVRLQNDPERLRSLTNFPYLRIPF